MYRRVSLTTRRFSRKSLPAKPSILPLSASVKAYTRDRMRLLPFLATVLALAATAAFAQAPEPAHEALRGLHELRVTVEELHSSATDAGLSKSLLETEVNTTLRGRGIVTVATSAAPPELPYLYLRVTTRKASSNGYPFFIELMLREPVLLARDNTVRSQATTWYWMSGGYISAVDSTRLAPDIREAVRDMTNRFADDYFRANSQP